MELFMKPSEQMAAMATLDFTASLPDGNRALPLRLEAGAVVLQEDIGQHRQRPETHNGGGAHQLIVIQAQLFFAIAKEHLDVPARRDMGKQQLWTGLQVARREVTCLRDRSIQGLAHDHDLAGVECAHACGHDMHVYLLLALRPLEQDIVTGSELSRIVGESLPPPALGRARIFDPQPAIALPAAGDQEAALLCRSPEAFGTVPAIEQDMRQRSGDRFKGADHGFHQVNLALERHSFRRADRLLSIQLGSQRTASPQQYIQALDQAMTFHSFLLRGRVMPTQSFHLLAFAFLNRRVIPNQVPCHNGWLGTASTLGLRLALPLQFCFDQRLHLFPKVPQPACNDSCRLPGCLCEKATQPGQARSKSNLTQQSSQGARPFTEHQPKPHDHEVLILGLGELLTKPFGKLSQLVIQTYNGNWHRTPPWLQESIFFFLIPHGVLSCYFPFQKCKHRARILNARNWYNYPGRSDLKEEQTVPRIITFAREGGFMKSMRVTYYVAICVFLLCLVVIVVKMTFWPVCVGITACDGWTVAGLAATILGVGATILTLLGAFTVAAWWLGLDKRVRNQVSALYETQKAEVERQVHTLLVEQQDRANEQIRHFQMDFAELESGFQTLQGTIEQLNQWVAETADLAFQALLINPPDNIDDLATKAMKQFNSPQIAEKMSLMYLERAESYFPTLSGTDNDTARAYTPVSFAIGSELCIGMD